ncbi:transmembrane amino acid transporter [Loa loa]|uniref:Transmembrane amino acid transporter n=1 Tax=Loa loa TaxID=7209 RepID=A0A1S0TYA0_LOALO|nr:transmembrane amino acid transporter [Loa loa]EFO21498.2 transmembrane amino acid transporter [Loa loa]
MSRSVGDSSNVLRKKADIKTAFGSELSQKAANTYVSDTEMEAKDVNTVSGPITSERGYSWMIASVIIVSDLVGGGVVAMPAAFHETGMLLGCLFMGIIAIFFTTTAYLLAQTWAIMRERWPVYKTHCRQPYPEIGMRSFGPKMTLNFTAFCVNMTLFGVTTVYIILSSSIFHKTLLYFGIRIDFCLLLIILAVLILPITFLRSPADFWFILAISLFSTIVAITLIWTGVSQDHSSCKSSAVYISPSFQSLYSLGTFVFAYSGHHVFPTIQHDMREPKDFTKSVLLGFFWTAKMYIPLAAYSYAVYGQSMRESVIDSLQTTWIRHGANLAVAIHCLLTIILTINPVNQQFENIFHVPHKMCWQRVAIRTGLVALMLFVALSIPNFGSIMDFFGSTTIPFTCVILPTLFGLSLKSQRYNEKTKKWQMATLKEICERTPRYVLCWYVFLNVVTIIASMISTLMAVKAMATIRFVPPCFMQLFTEPTDHHLNTTTSLLNCCGRYSNITWNPENQCLSH